MGGGYRAQTLPAIWYTTSHVATCPARDLGHVLAEYLDK